jgi:nucleotide-binding universal stress UspA family protein
MHRYRHLMVGLTRSEADAELLRYAAMVARLGTAREARCVHVLPTAAEAAKGMDHDHAVAQLKADVAAHFTKVPDTVEVYCDVLKGPLLDRLLQFAAEQEDDVVFVGGSGTESPRRSLARRLAMKAPCSVWMVPDGSPAQIRRILVPVDFSEDAADAMQVAVAMAQLLGHAEVLALHVYFNEAAVTFEEYDQVLRGEEQQAFRRFIAPLDCRGVRVKPLFVEAANVAGAILRVADEQGADLIVLASRGRSQSAAILLGSVAEETLIGSGVPTLIVKHFGARLGLLQVLLDRRFRQRSGPRSG